MFNSAGPAAFTLKDGAEYLSAAIRKQTSEAGDPVISVAACLTCFYKTENPSGYCWI